MTRSRLLLFATLCATVLLVLAPTRSARADDEDVGALIKLVDKKPAGMSRDEWLEERREAARKLGRLGDKKAVPVLIRVVEKEKFDVVAEIAIESLGRLGDDRAVDVLRSVVEDSSRDRYVRDAAKKALKRIGVDVGDDVGDGGGKTGGGKTGGGKTGGGETGGGETGGGETGGGDDERLVRVSGGGSILGDDARHDIPAGPAFPQDLLSASERLTFAAGNVSLSYDTQRETAVLDGDVSALYEKIVEREKLGYSYRGTGALAFGVIDYPGDDTLSRAGSFELDGAGEARMYMSDSKAYAQAQAAAGLSGIHFRNASPGGVDRETFLSGDVAVAIGGGWGRIHDVGEGLRLRRLQQVLADARMLGRPISEDLARKLLGTWWALRGEQGALRRLLATVAILRDAGVLLGEPDAGTTYKILQVLLDGQLDHRLEGFDVRLGAAEAFLIREEGSPAEGLDGRHETLFSLARYGRQDRDALGEIVGTAFGTYELGDSDAGEPSPWAIGGHVAWRRYFYNRAFDPIGALEITGEAGLSDPDVDDGDPDGGMASRLAGTIGWVWLPNRASHYRLAAAVHTETGDLFLGVTFDVAYGLLDAGFVGGGALPAAISD